MKIRRILLRSAIFVILFVLAIVFYHQMQRNRESYWQTEMITFQLPLPDNVWEQYKIMEPLETNQIAAVYIAGFFNSWNPLNPYYKMKQVAPGTWEKPVMLYGGENQYKFVVYIKGREVPIWTHDILNKEITDDHFGGYNSVITKKDTRTLFQAGFYILLIALFFFLLYVILDIITYVVHHYRLGLQTKIVLMVLLVSVLAMGINTFVNIRQVRITASAGLTDSMNMIHLFLEGQDIDFNRLHVPEVVSNIESTVSNFFFSARARVQQNTPSNNETFLSSFLVFDTDLNLISLQRREEGMEMAFRAMEMFGYTNIVDYYRYFIFGSLCSEVLSNKSARYQIQYREMPKELFKTMNLRDKISAVFLGYENILVPIIIDQQLKGYYGATIHSQIPGRSIYYMIGFNILSGVVVALFILIYFLFFHKDPSETYLFERFFSRYSISKREQDVVLLLCEGYSNNDISKKLFISEGTVKAHIYHVFQKAEVTHRLELINLIKSLK